MPAGSLLQMAKRQAIRSIDTITDIGDLSYEFVRPMLIKLENPEQLRGLEKRCPQIAGEDAEIWKRFIKRDILNWEKKLREPSNPKSWSKVYQKLLQESEHEFQKQQEELRAALQVRADEKAKNTTTISTKVIDPERRRRRVNQCYGDKSGQVSASSRTDNARGAVDRIKRQTQEARNRRNTGLKTPAHILQNRSNGVQKAPPGMIVEHQLQQRQQIPLQQLQQQDNAIDRQIAEPSKRTMIPPRRGSNSLLRQNQELRKQDRENGITASTDELAGSADLASREARLKPSQGGSKIFSTTDQGTHQTSSSAKLKGITASSRSSHSQQKSSTLSNQESSLSPEPTSRTQIVRPQTSTSHHTSLQLPSALSSDSASPFKAPRRESPKPKRKRQVNALMPMKRSAR